MKILVVGIRNEGLLKLKKTFEGVKFEGLGDQDNHKRRVKHSKSFDMVISVTKFTNHTTEKIMGNQDNYHRIGNQQGLSTVIKLITEKMKSGQFSITE